MNKKMFLLAITIGVSLTLFSVLYAHKSPTPKCGNFSYGYPGPPKYLNRVERGFPFPYLVIEPSVSICQSVESIAILNEGNAYHEEHIVAALFDVIFWSGIVSLILVARQQKGHKR